MTEQQRTVTTEPNDLPPRPKKPTRMLGNGATDRQAREHYSAMMDYWIAEAMWQELRTNRMVTGIKALQAKCCGSDDLCNGCRALLGLLK